MTLPSHDELLDLAPGNPGGFAGWCRALLGWSPHAKQAGYGDSRARTLYAVCGIRFGKSDMAAARLLFCMFYGAGQAYLNAAFSQDQANIVVEKAVAMAYASPFKVFVSDYKRSPHPTLTLKNGATLQARSTSDANLLRGRAYYGVNIDEGAFARKDDVEVLRGRTLDHNGWLSITTTAQGQNFLFPLFVKAHQAMVSGSPAHFAMTGSTWDNPHIPREALEQIKEEYTERKYRQEILGEFVDLEGATFPQEVLDRIFVEGLAVESEPQKGGIYAAGWDLGRKVSLSVGTVVEGAGERLRLVAVDRHEGKPWTVVERAVEEMHRYWGAHTMIDGTGVGDPIEGHLEIPVSTFLFSAKSRANLITEMQQVCHRGDIVIPRTQALMPLYTSMLLHTWKEDAEDQTWDDLDSAMLAVHHAREITFKGPLLFRLQ